MAVLAKHSARDACSGTDIKNEPLFSRGNGEYFDGSLSEFSLDLNHAGIDGILLGLVEVVEDFCGGHLLGTFGRH